MGAKVRASLTYSDLVDRLTAAWARIAGLLIDLEMILKISPAVDPVNTGAVGFDSSLQGVSDGFQQPGSILYIKFFAGLERVFARSK